MWIAVSNERNQSGRGNDEPSISLPKIAIPKLGLVKARGKTNLVGKQKILRVVRKASGWFAQVIIEQVLDTPTNGGPCNNPVGIDVGLTHFASMSNGTVIDNPQLLKTDSAKIRRCHRAIARKVKGSCNYQKAIMRHARCHEKITSRRRDFAHQLSRRLVNQHDFIAIEDLTIKGLASGIFAKPVNDVAWGLFFFCLAYKAEKAGKTLVKVIPHNTSQTCPGCGAIKKKSIKERVHLCACAANGMDRDVASAKVILNRAMGVAVAKPVEGLTTTIKRKARRQVSPMKQVAC